MMSSHHARHVAGLIGVALVTSTCGGSTPISPGQPDPRGIPVPAKPIDAPLAACPSAAELASLSGLNVALDSGLLGGPLVCRAATGSADLNEMQRFIYRTLLFLRQTEFDAPLPWTDKSAWMWLTDLNPRILFFESPGSRSCSGPCLKGTAQLNMTMQTGVPLTWLNVMATAAVIVHEARHIEIGGHPCNGTLDNRADDLLAFGAHYYYRVWVERHTSPDRFPTELRAQLAADNCTMRTSVFCNDPCTAKSN
jgi:hypothetical protein